MANRLRLILAVTLALSMGILVVSSTTLAQTTQTPTGLDSVRVLEGNWQTLSPGSQHWYRFDYTGEDLPVRVSLDVNAANSAQFQIWTAAQFSELAANTDLSPVATGAPDGADPTHIGWEGTLGEAGSYYIVVQPATEADTQYLLTIGGRGLAPAADGGTIVAGALNVNMRSGPSTAYSVVRTIPQGTQLTVLGQDSSGTWLSVRLADGTEGWIARFLTNFTDNVSIVAAPSPPPLAPPATTAPVTPDLTGASNVNVRAGPSTLYPVIRTVPSGTVFTILGQDASGTWLSVRFSDGTEGWIARFLTDFTGTVSIVSVPPAAQPPLAPPATGTTDPNAAVVSGAANVNIRTGPSTAYPVIRTVPNGTQLTVLGQDVTTGWLSVQLSDGTAGWIARWLTNFAGAVPEAPEQPPLAPPPTAPEDPGAGPAPLPSQAASVSNFPIEQSLADNWRILPANGIHWYTFSHPGDNQPVQIWMNADPAEATGFRVFSENDGQAIMAGANPDDFEAIGRGTPNDSEPADLFWRGEFEEHGRYYVMVDSSSREDTGYSIYGVGPSIGG